MGRAGLEPATLGLEVRPHMPPQTATRGIWLQVVGFRTATHCSEMRLAETGRYAHRTRTGVVTRRAGLTSDCPSRMSPPALTPPPEVETALGACLWAPVRVFDKDLEVRAYVPRVVRGFAEDEIEALRRR